MYSSGTLLDDGQENMTTQHRTKKSIRIAGYSAAKKKAIENSAMQIQFSRNHLPSDGREQV